MRAIQYDEFGDYDVLKAVDVPVPVPAPGQALVRLTLAGVNPLDDTVRRGKLPAAAVRPLPIRPGGFGVGVLTEPGATALPAGTRVVLSGGRYGVGTDGTWAEYVAVDPRHVLPLPDDVDDTAAAALTAATGHLTAYLALTELAGFRPGQSVLAPGVGGGVGQGGVEIARVLGAGAAITTATTTAKADRGRALGFEVIDLSTESLRDGVHRLTGGRGVDVVLDGVGGPVTGAALGSLAVDGTLVSIGYTASTRTEIDVTDLIWKNAHIHGFRFALFTPEQINAANTHLLELLARKEITPLVDRVFPLEQAAQAQRHLAEGSPFGRVLPAI
ncbi:quinone oxidoreductase family protein [Amycolatopsis lexingtonensis]|uniref:quinone oxidoreductase family protein n=1 Tax=Amycolatopsis lexingtonensis TaxID=218822 RepID=UPI003F703000